MLHLKSQLMEKNMQRMTTLMLLGALAWTGCGDDDGPSLDTGTDSGMDASVDGGNDSGVDAGQDSGSDSGNTGDGNDSFAEAVEILETVAEGVIGTQDDVDYFRFDGSEGDWVLIATDANPEDNPDALDTVLTLYDSSMTKIAENDDAFPRASTDSAIITRLPATGTYYVTVQEWSTWARETGEFGDNFQYRVVAEPIDFSTFVNTEHGGGATPTQMSFALNNGIQFSTAVGELSSTPADFRFTVVEARPSVTSYLLPGGITGNGSTGAPAMMEVWSEDASELIAQIDPSLFEGTGTIEVGPHLDPGTYLLRMVGGTPGDNGFFVLRTFLTGGNPPEDESMDAANNLPSGAQALTQRNDGEVSRAFIAATLPVGDTDHFSFQVDNPAHVVTAVCGSRSSGSGIDALTVELTNDAGVAFASAVETATESAVIENQAVSGAGTYLLKLTRGAQLGDVTGNFVRCGIAIGAASN